MDPDVSFRIVRVQMWEKGHSFDEIDDMSVQDMGDVLAYWSEKARVSEKRENTRKSLKGG